MKSLYNKLLPKPRYSTFIWDVSVVLRYLSTLFPFGSTVIKVVDIKIDCFNCLSSAPRAQTTVSLNLDCMTVFNSKVLFQLKNLLKTSKQGKNYVLELLHYEDEKLCVIHTLLHYTDRTKEQRKSQQLLLSYCSFKPVTSSTVVVGLRTYCIGVELTLINLRLIPIVQLQFLQLFLKDVL